MAGQDIITTVLSIKPGADFVKTPYIGELTERALDYLRAGFPVHISGPVGVGKTTLALHIAAQLGRPSVLISGNHELNSSDLVGGISGYHKRYIRDNFIQAVLKADEKVTQSWVDNRLMVACEKGLTLIYDEFTRSRPEANNILLSVLEERILPLSLSRGSENYLRVHPSFCAIFTSNPREYAGVYRSQDALRDRMATIELNNFDEETEIAITQAKSRLSREDAQRIVTLVRKVRKSLADETVPTVRACILIGKVLRQKTKPSDVFKQTCMNALIPEIPQEDREGVRQVISDFQVKREKEAE